MGSITIIFLISLKAPRYLTITMAYCVCKSCSGCKLVLHIPFFSHKLPYGHDSVLVEKTEPQQRSISVKPPNWQTLPAAAQTPALLSFRWVFVWEKGYQETDSVVSSVTTKAKGVAVTNTSELGFRIWDVADYVIPAQVGLPRDVCPICKLCFSFSSGLGTLNL